MRLFVVLVCQTLPPSAPDNDKTLLIVLVTVLPALCIIFATLALVWRFVIRNKLSR